MNNVDLAELEFTLQPHIASSDMGGFLSNLILNGDQVVMVCTILSLCIESKVT